MSSGPEKPLCHRDSGGTAAAPDCESATAGRRYGRRRGDIAIRPYDDIWDSEPRAKRIFYCDRAAALGDAPRRRGCNPSLSHRLSGQQGPRVGAGTAAGRRRVGCGGACDQGTAAKVPAPPVSTCDRLHDAGAGRPAGSDLGSCTCKSNNAQAARAVLPALVHCGLSE